MSKNFYYICFNLLTLLIYIVMMAWTKKARSHIQKNKKSMKFPPWVKKRERERERGGEREKFSI